MLKILKKDSFILGIALGLLMPMAVFGILYAAVGLIKSFYMAGLLQGTLLLVSIFMNMFALRHYLLKEKFDKSGRGILLATFIYAIVYFYLYFN
jgi:hypothetical protein